MSDGDPGIIGASNGDQLWQELPGGIDPVPMLLLFS